VGRRATRNDGGGQRDGTTAATRRVACLPSLVSRYKTRLGREASFYFYFFSSLRDLGSPLGALVRL